MPPETKQRCFDLRCRSKRGEKLSRKDSQFLQKCFDKYPEEYGAMDREVFDATKPFGAF